MANRRTHITSPTLRHTAAATLLLAALTLHSVAEPIFTVRMKGRADGVGLTAQRLAVENARRQVMVDVLQSMTNSEDMAPFRGMLRQASRYFQRCHLLRTDVIGQTTVVEIDASILERPLRHDLAAIMLPRLPRPPSVLMLIAEYIGPEAYTGGPTFDVAESVFRERVADFGFTLTGMHSLINHFDIADLVAVINGDVSEVAAFARANHEDVIIVGSITTEHDPLAPDSNMLRNRAAAVLRVFSGHDGKMMDLLTSQAIVQSVEPVEGGEQAVRDACAKLVGDYIVAVVLTMLSLEDESRVLIEVENPRAEETVAQMIQVIQRVPGVHSVERLFFSETLARLAVDYDGPMADFSDYIADRMINNRKVDVTRCVKREMTISFQ